MKRSNPYQSKQGAKRQKTSHSVDSKVKALERKVNKIQRAVELKQIETAETTDFVSLATTGWGYSVGMSDILQGVGEQERIGTEITVHKIEITCRITVPDSTLVPLGVRFLIFNDKQHSNSATTAAANPFSGTTSPLEEMVAGNDYVTAMLRKWDMRSRYTFYRDQAEIINPQAVYQFTPATGLTTRLIPTTILRKFVVNIPQVKVYYTGPEKANNTVSRNFFQLGVYMDTGGATPPQMSCSTRLIFTD